MCVCVSMNLFWQLKKLYLTFITIDYNIILKNVSEFKLNANATNIFNAFKRKKNIF